MKRKKEKPIKIDYINKVVDRSGFFVCLFKLGFSKSVYIPSFDFVQCLVVA